MATRKKAKKAKKVKAKRASKPATKPVARKKVRAVKKAPAQKKAVPKKKPVARKKPAPKKKVTKPAPRAAQAWLPSFSVQAFSSQRVSSSVLLSSAQVPS